MSWHSSSIPATVRSVRRCRRSGWLSFSCWWATAGSSGHCCQHLQTLGILGTDDELRLLQQHGFLADLRIGRRAAGKRIVTATPGDGILDPAAFGNRGQWWRPELIQQSYRLTVLVLLLESLKIGLHLQCQAFSLSTMTGGFAELTQISWQILQPTGVDHQHRYSQRLDLMHHQLLIAAPDQHQIRPQRR